MNISYARAHIVEQGCENRPLGRDAAGDFREHLGASGRLERINLWRDVLLARTTAQGRLVFNLFASLAEFERDVIRGRTQAGLTAARARGRKGGRPKGLPVKAEPMACAAETLYRDGKLSAEQIAQRLHTSIGFLTPVDYEAALIAA